MCVVTKINFISSYENIKISHREDQSLGMISFSIFVELQGTYCLNMLKNDDDTTSDD